MLNTKESVNLLIFQRDYNLASRCSYSHGSKLDSPDMYVCRHRNRDETILTHWLLTNGKNDAKITFANSNIKVRKEKIDFLFLEEISHSKEKQKFLLLIDLGLFSASFYHFFQHPRVLGVACHKI